MNTGSAMELWDDRDLCFRCLRFLLINFCAYQEVQPILQTVSNAIMHFPISSIWIFYYYWLRIQLRNVFRTLLSVVITEVSGKTRKLYWKKLCACVLCFSIDYLCQNNSCHFVLVILVACSLPLFLLPYFSFWPLACTPSKKTFLTECPNLNDSCPHTTVILIRLNLET